MEAKDNKIPFDEQKWKEGWKPVTRDGRDVRDFSKSKIDGFLLGKVGTINRMWYPNGDYSGNGIHFLDLMLLPPDDEIVVEVRKIGNNGTQTIFSCGKHNLKEGKYRLTKIG